MPSREPTSAAGDDSATADDGACTISGIACPDEHTDTDVDYTHINSSNNKWVWSGTTSDGRSWYENDDVSDEVKYLYYSTRAGGWFLTATAPDLSAADPWVGDNNAVRLNGQGHGDSPDGVFHDADLYCGHDTGNPADGCRKTPRGDGRDMYHCGNDGTVTVSCGSGHFARYEVSGGPMTFSSCEDHCASLGGTVACVTSDADETALDALRAGAMCGEVWVGFNDADGDLSLIHI